SRFRRRRTTPVLRDIGDVQRAKCEIPSKASFLSSYSPHVRAGAHRRRSSRLICRLLHTRDEPEGRTVTREHIIYKLPGPQSREVALPSSTMRHSVAAVCSIWRYALTSSS